MVPRPGGSFPALLVVVRPSSRQGGDARRLLLAVPPARCCGGQQERYSTVVLARNTNNKRGRPGAWRAGAAAAAITQHPLEQRRGVSSGEGAGPEEAAAVAGSKGVLLYKGGHGDVIRTLKRVSLTTCAIGLASSPFFLALGSETVPMAANAALTGIVLLATCGPTVLLHAFTKPYIFSLRRLPPAAATAPDAGAVAKPSSSSTNGHSDPRFRAETMDFLTRRAFSEFALSSVKPLPNTTRPFATFEADGRLYFVHGETFADKALLQRLVGRPLKEAEAVPMEPPEDDEEE